MKKIIIFLIVCVIGSNSFANGTRDIDKRLIQSFKALFPNAQEVNWHEREGSYEVYFIENGTNTRITYLKNDSFVQFIRYYQESNLPSYIQYRIKQAFPGKIIYGVTERSTISGPEKIIKVEYNIRMEDDKNWTTVRLDADGTLSVVEKFRKAI